MATEVRCRFVLVQHRHQSVRQAMGRAVFSDGQHREMSCDDQVLGPVQKV